MGADASPYARLRRALDGRSLIQAEAAARELATLADADALSLVLLMLEERDARFEPAGVRWLGRWLAAHPGAGFEVARQLADALAGLHGASPDVARSQAAFLLRSAGSSDSAAVLERW